MKTKTVYHVTIGYRDPVISDIRDYTKVFYNRADVVRYIKQVRRDSHDVNFVLTNDWIYNDIINSAFDNIFLQVTVREYFGFDRTYSARKLHNIYRPHIALDENGNWIDLNK